MKLSPGDIFADRYRLSKQLGVGGFSEVWLAEDTKSELVQVAVKIYASGNGLDTEGLSVFSKEYALLFNLNHPGLLKAMHYDDWEGKPYLVMQYMPNGSCAKYTGNFTELQAAQLMQQVCSALDYLHSQEPPIIHQDIKPDNILMNTQGKYLLSDFGISSKIRRSLSRSMGSRAEQSSGTTAYMAPERFSTNLEKRAPIKANDIFSLGVTLFELLTGELPFGELGGMVANTGNEPAYLPEHYSSGLRQLISWCLNKEPHLRPIASELIESADSYVKYNIWGIPERLTHPVISTEEENYEGKGATKKLNPAETHNHQIRENTDNNISRHFPSSNHDNTHFQENSKVLRKKKIIKYSAVFLAVGIITACIMLFFVRKNEPIINQLSIYQDSTKKANKVTIDPKSSFGNSNAKKQRKTSAEEEIYYTAITRGNSALKETNYEEAIEQYEIALQYKPGNEHAAQLLDKAKTLLNEQIKAQNGKAKEEKLNIEIEKLQKTIEAAELRFLNDHALLFVDLQSMTGIMRSYHLNLAGKTYLIEQKMKLSANGNTVTLVGEDAYNIDRKKYIVYLTDEMYINYDDEGNVESIQMLGDENPTVNPFDLESDYAKELFRYFRWESNPYSKAREKLVAKIENEFNK